jgi:predicted  nucleic acid-binding Zn-ribbon protein
MSTTSNYPSATPQSNPPKKDFRGLIIGLLAVGLLGTWGYLLWNNNKNEQTILTKDTQIAKVTDEKGELQRSFDASLARLDSVTGSNNQLQTKLTDANSDIAKKKAEIRSILNKRNATAAELSRAKELIGQLNDKIAGMEKQIEELTASNTQLTTEKTQLTADKEKLTTDLATTAAAKDVADKKVDVASTLNASSISISPINERKNGKESVTTSAKRVDKLVIAFDVDNRIAQSGNTDVYVCITGPDGKPITVEALGSGTFTTREEGDKLFTAKVPVEYESGKKKHVEFAWKQNSDFQRGNYKIEIYHNGFKIGEGTRELKKGGLFG